MNWDALDYYRNMPEEDKPLYNGMTIEQIENNIRESMSNIHEKEYLDNCRQVITNQMTGYNLNQIDSIKNYNFDLTMYYLVLAGEYSK